LNQQIGWLVVPVSSAGHAENMAKVVASYICTFNK